MSSSMKFQSYNFKKYSSSSGLNRLDIWVSIVSMMTNWLYWEIVDVLLLGWDWVCMWSCGIFILFMLFILLIVGLTSELILVILCLLLLHYIILLRLLYKICVYRYKGTIDYFLSKSGTSCSYRENMIDIM